MSMPWSNEVVSRSIHLIGKLSQLNERLQTGEKVSRQEAVQAVQDLEELEALAHVPGALQMHQKYRSLLHPCLDFYGLVSAPTPPQWDQGAAMRHALVLFAQSLSKSQVVDFVHHLLQVVQQVRDGASVPLDDVESIFSQLDEMDQAVRQLEVEYPQLPGMFERGVQRLRAELEELGNRGVSAANDSALRGDFEEALDLYETASTLFLAIRDRDGQGMALLGQAHAFQNLEQCEAAEAAYQEAQRCFQDSGARRSECQLVYAWGNLCREQSRFERAMELYAHGISLADAEGVEARRAEGHRRIGDAWADQGNFSDAIVSYQMALDIANGAGNGAEQRQTWSSLGRLYATLQRPFDAIKCFECALDLVDEETHPEEWVALLFHLADARLDAGQHNEALESWSQAVAIAQEVEDPTVSEMVGLFGSKG